MLRALLAHLSMHGIFFEPPIIKNYLGHQLSEIYKEGVYAPFFNGKKGLTVVDVGANIGITSYYFSQYAKVVHAVEPSYEHFKVLTHMIVWNNLDNVKAHKQAIWMKNMDEAPFYHNVGNKTMYSLHSGVHDGKVEPEKVPVVTIDKFFKDNKIDHCDFLKLDVEGSEFEVLGGPGFKKVAPKIDVVFLEWHKWAKRNPAQLNQSLESNGFSVETIKADADLLVGVKK